VNKQMTMWLIPLTFVAAPVVAQTSDLGAVTRSNIAAATIDPNPMPVLGGSGTSANIKRQIAAQRRYASGKVNDFVPPKQADFFPGKSSGGDAAGTATAGLPR